VLEVCDHDDVEDDIEPLGGIEKVLWLEER